MLILFQTVLLAVDSASNVYNDPRSKSWGTSWIDYALLSLFIIYSYVSVMVPHWDAAADDSFQG